MIQFSAITDDKHIYSDSTQILSHLTHHFKARFAAPDINLNNVSDREAYIIWKNLSQAELHDIQLACQKSDLQFTPKEVWDVISSIKSKNSSSFARIPNRMIKQIPKTYAHILALQYNALFSSVFWGKSWKQARTICFNKSDSPAPTTQ